MHCAAFNGAQYIFSLAKLFKNMFPKRVHHFGTTAAVIICRNFSEKKSYTEAKPKVVTADLGTELFTLNAELEIYRQDHFKKRINK